MSEIEANMTTQSPAFLETNGGVRVPITVPGTWPDVPDAIICGDRVFTQQFAGYGESTLRYVEVGKTMVYPVSNLPT